MTVSDLIQVIMMGLLVVVTGIYAWRTHVISKATKAQADASVRTVDEMRKQTIMSSRPVIIQKAQQKKAIQGTITIDYFSHFEIYNAGNGPAIEIEIFLLNDEKSPIFGNRETYLRAGESPVKLLPVEFEKEQLLPDIDPPIILMPINLALREGNTYLVSQYQSIFSFGRQPTWYQTWLPFKARKASKKGETYVTPGELEFKDEVTEEDRIYMFGSKPK